MANGKMSFVIEMENGQYLRATNEVVRSTEKIERQTSKSFGRMDKVGRDVSGKFRRYFSIGALFGGAFGLAFSGINKVFAMFNKGISSAIDKNEDLKRSFSDLQDKSDELWTAIGEKSAPVLNEIGKFIYDILDSNNSLVNIQAGMSESDLRKSLKVINDLLADARNKGINVQDPKNYWNVYLKQQEEVERKLKRFDDERAKRRKENLEKLKKAQDEYNKSIEGLSSKVFDMVGGDSNVKAFVGSLNEAGKEVEAISKSFEEAAKQGKQLTLSGDALTSILLAAYAVISTITTGLIKIVSENKEAQDALKSLVEQAEKYNNIIGTINNNLKKINYELERQKSIDNDSLENIDAEISKYKDLIKAQEESLATNKQRVSDAKGNTEALEKEHTIRKDMVRLAQESVDFYKNNPLGVAINVVSFGAAGAGAEAALKREQDNLALLEQKIADNKEALEVEAELGGIENEIFNLNKEMNELLKERTTLLQNQALETQGLEERLLDAKLDGAKTDAEAAKFIEQLIKNIEDQIEAYQQILDVTTDKNEKLEVEADIQEHLNQIADLRTKKEEVITKNLQKQVDILKQYVDLGLDLENIRVVKQLTKGFAAQGLSGTQLGGALQDLGVSNRAISGKTLNIYGDINNTLNQASPSALISNMNDLINKIGGA